MIPSLLSALALLVSIFALMMWLKRPIYRLEHRNLENLFQMVLQDRATENDWNVFVDVPIRYQPDFEDLRLRCCELTELHGRYREGMFSLSEAGKLVLQKELEKLQSSREG